MVERCPDKTEVEGPIPSTLTNMENDWKKQVLHFYARTTGWIVVPALVAVMLNKYALNGEQLFVIVGISFIITVFGVWREIKKYQKSL